MLQNKKALLFIVLALALGGAAFFLLSQPEPQTQPEAQDTSLGGQQSDASEAADQQSLDLEGALKERVLGDTGAPIKIAEHASFTCSHCAVFHANTFEQLKKNYIDTGKAYLVFSDFPLNAPALHASMTARCVPEDRYFDFVSMLFSTQDQWAFEQNYMSYLRNRAAEYGLNDTAFDACLGSEELQKGIVEKIAAVQTQWKISSTPSFVINNKTVISGALPYDEFVKALEQAQAPSDSDSSQAPDTQGDGSVTE